MLGHFWQHCKPAAPHKLAHGVEAPAPRRVLVLAMDEMGNRAGSDIPVSGEIGTGGAQLVDAGLVASRSAIGARNIASSLACVMPMREDGTHGDKEQKGCANRNDQVHPKIPAITFLGHEWLYAHVANAEA